MSFKTILATITIFIVALFTILPASAQSELPKDCVGECSLISTSKPSNTKDIELELPSTCNGPCPLIANPAEEVLPISKSEATTNLILGIARFLAFLAVAVSIILTPIGLIVSLILQFVVKKNAKWAWITTACLFGLFFIAIIGYTIVGLLVAQSMGDLSSAFGR